MKPNYYREHLDRVSRSFAFCIERLDGDLRDWVSLSYLLCRMLDTVEDSTWLSSQAQDEAFETFRFFLEQRPIEVQVKAWALKFPGDVVPGEAALLHDSFPCFEAFHRLNPELRAKIQVPVLNMYRGMRYFLSKRKKQELRLNSLIEVNQYCFFVAGLVGGLLTDLVAFRWPAWQVSSGVYLDAHHFGLFLQKINLLKDQSKDEKEGRFLVPARAELLHSLAANAEGALRYLQSLPLAEKGFRLFCAWSLFLGLASLPWIEKSTFMGLFLKIPRLVTDRLLHSVEGVIDDNDALARMFREMLPDFSQKTVPLVIEGSTQWLRDIYDGALGVEEFRELGLVSSNSPNYSVSIN